MKYCLLAAGRREGDVEKEKEQPIIWLQETYAVHGDLLTVLTQTALLLKVLKRQVCGKGKKKEGVRAKSLHN